MARKKRRKGGVNKSEEIRKYLGIKPNAGPKEVATALADKGLQVSLQLVSHVKARLNSAAGRMKSRRVKVRRPKSKRVGRPRSAGTAGLTAGDLLETKRVVDQLGGVKRARQALDALEKLQ